MRYCALVLWLTGMLVAQQARQTSIRSYDLNGRPVADGVITDTNGTTVESITGVNGRTVPLEKVEERVLREDSSSRVIERTVRPYDQNGAPGPARKIRIEEEKNADGSVNSLTTVYRGDLNGSFVLAERVRRDAAKSGDLESSTTTVEQPTLNNSLEVVETRRGTLKKTEAASQEDVLTYRRDENGRFQEAVRRVTERAEKDGHASEKTNEYIAGEGGKLKFNGLVVSESEKRADGSEIKQVSVYGDVAAGRPGTGSPQLREQQLIEKRAGPGGSLLETFSVRRPALDNPNDLGAYQKISERVCTGDCSKK